MFKKTLVDDLGGLYDGNITTAGLKPLERPTKRSDPSLGINFYSVLFFATLTTISVLFIASFVPYYSKRGREIEKCVDVFYHSNLCNDVMVNMLYGAGEARSAKVLSDIEIEGIRYKESSMTCESALLCTQESQFWAAINHWYANGPIHELMNASTWELKVIYAIVAIVFVWKMAEGLKFTQILKTMTRQTPGVIQLRGASQNVALVQRK